MSTVVQMLAPLSEAPDPDAPSESGRPESGWSGSSGTGTDRGGESSGSYRSRGFGRGTDSGSGRGGGPFPPGGGGPFFPGAGGAVVRPLIQTRPAGYQEYVTPENAEGLHPVHMSPEIRVSYKEFGNEVKRGGRSMYHIPCETDSASLRS